MSNNPQYDPKEFTANFDLALFAPMGVTWREDSTAGSIIDANMIAIDAELEALAAGGGGASVKVNGATVAHPNFNNSVPAAPAGSVNVQFQVDGSGDIAAYVVSSGMVQEFTVGTGGGAVTVGMALMFDTDGSNTIVFPADGGLQPNSPFAGVAVSNAAEGESVQVQVSGVQSVLTDGTLQPSALVTAQNGGAGTVTNYSPSAGALSNNCLGNYILGVTVGPFDSDTNLQPVLITPYLIPSVGVQVNSFNTTSLSPNSLNTQGGVVGNAVEYLILGTGGSLGITRTLPPARLSYQAPDGVRVTVVKVDSGAGAVTLLPYSGDTINGGGSLSTGNSIYSFFVLMSDNVNNWYVVAQSSTGFANPMTAHGDIIYEDASLGPHALPIGSGGTVLTSSGGQPAWVAPTVYDTLGAAAMALAAAESYTDSSVAAEASARTTADGLLVPKTTTVNGHALSGDVTVAFADIASGALANGTTATTQSAGDNSTKVGTTAYADAAVSVEASARTTADGLLVPKTTTVNGNALSGNVTVALDQLGNPTGQATFTMTANTGVEMDWAAATSNTAFYLKNTAVAVNNSTLQSPRVQLSSNGFGSGSSLVDLWSLFAIHGTVNNNEMVLAIASTTNNSGAASWIELQTGGSGKALGIRFSGTTSGTCQVSTPATAATFDVSKPVNATTGFRIGNAAASGNVLRGNGTNFVAAVLAAADLSNGVTGSGAVVLATAPTVSALTVTGKITSYNAISTVGNGVVSETGLLDVTAKAASLAATTIYTPTATGRYRISIYSQVTVAATSSSILGGATGFVVTYTDGTAAGAAQSVTVAMENSAGSIVTTSATNSTANVLTGVLFLYAKTGVAIQLAVGYTSVGVTPMQYEVHAVCEAM